MSTVMPWMETSPDPPQIHNQFLCQCHIELQVVLVKLCDKVTNYSPVFSIIAIADTSNYRNHLKTSGDGRTVW